MKVGRDGDNIEDTVAKAEGGLISTETFTDATARILLPSDTILLKVVIRFPTINRIAIRTPSPDERFGLFAVFIGKLLEDVDTVTTQFRVHFLAAS